MRGNRSGRSAGFTMVELLLVLAIVAVAAGLVTWALPDGESTRLEEDAARLTALLDMARAESRVSGAPVHWVPRAGAEPGEPDANGRVRAFRFVGLPTSLALPGHWLDARISAEVPTSAGVIVLGPEAILPPQRILLRLGRHELQLASDGLGPFVVQATGAAPGGQAGAAQAPAVAGSPSRTAGAAR